MPPTVRVIIQARVGSTRMPRKILAPLAGEPMLAHVVRRLQAAGDHQVSVATTMNAEDDHTEDLCRQLGVPCFRGASDDVLARYVAAADDLSDNDIVIRATADNPVYCPVRTARILARHLEQPADYTCITDLSYVVPEVIRARALRSMARLADDPYCREHVTPYFRRGPGNFRVQQLPANWQGLRPDIPLTVDTPQEYRRMAGIFTALGRGGRLFTLEEVYQHEDASRTTPRGRGRLRLDRPAAL